jgi:hypothetical protein
MELMVVME